MKLLALATLLLAAMVAPLCRAQYFANSDWSEHNGLTVASSQEIAVAATKIRCFATFEAEDDDPRECLTMLAAQKEQALAALLAIGVSRDAIAFSSPVVKRWKTETGRFSSRRDPDALTLESDGGLQSAKLHARFDVFIDQEDLISLAPLDVCEPLREHAIFASRPILAQYVGEVSDAQVAEAMKAAYKEAHGYAESLAAITGRPLGKLVAVTPRIDNYWFYSYRYFWSSLNSSGDYEALREFRRGENEVVGFNPQRLVRTYGLQLRYEIE